MKQFNYRAAFNIIIIGIIMLISEMLKGQRFDVLTSYKVFEGKSGIELYNVKTHFEISKEGVKINGMPEKVTAFYHGEDYDGTSYKYVFVTETNTFVSVKVSKSGNVLEIGARSYLMKRPTRYFQSIPEAFKYLDFGVTEIKQYPYPDSRSEDKRR